MAVILVPPTSFWSRARHVEGGQWPQRSRAQPLRLSVLSALHRQPVLQSNQVLEVTSWVAHHARRFHFSKVYLLLVMPEDFGGHCELGPSSPWDLPEFRGLQGAGDAVRGAAFFVPSCASGTKAPCRYPHEFPRPSKRFASRLACCGTRTEIFGRIRAPFHVTVNVLGHTVPRSVFLETPFFRLRLCPFLFPFGDVFYVLFTWVHAPLPLGLGRCAAASSGPSPTGSSLPVCTSSWALKEATGSMFPLFTAWSSSALSRNLPRAYADAGWVDRFSFVCSILPGPALLETVLRLGRWFGKSMSSVCSRRFRLVWAQRLLRCFRRVRVRGLAVL